MCPVGLLSDVAAPGLDGAFVDAEAVVRDYQVGVDRKALSEAVALERMTAQAVGEDLLIEAYVADAAR